VHRKKEIAILQRLVILVVLGLQAQGTRLDTHVDVLGDQHHLAWLVRLLQCAHHTQNLVICLARGQCQRQAQVQCLCLKEQLALGVGIARGVEWQTLGHVEALRSGQSIQGAAGLACVAGHLGHAFL